MLLNKLIFKKSSITNSFYSLHFNNRYFTSKLQKHDPQLFTALKNHGYNKTTTPIFLQNKYVLRNVLHSIGVYKPGQYLHDHFTDWLSAYARQSSILKTYFSGETDLNFLCKDFIQFCFEGNICLDRDKTLQSFEHHDAISDSAVKNELTSLKPKKEVNLLGFGLGNGYYEKNIVNYLLEQNLAKSVKLYGFDPFAEKSTEIEFLTSEQLINCDTPIFDLITARWVLHHVELQNRWTDFINSINRSKANALVLIVEHGFLQHPISVHDKRLYEVLNATFDVIANIGIRPHWFTSTTPNIGINFFIRYLQPSDFNMIKNDITIQMTQTIYDVGPAFPNQTVCCMKVPN